MTNVLSSYSLTYSLSISTNQYNFPMKRILFLTILLSNITVQAQIHRQYTNQTHHNETIVVKHKSATDESILAELNQQSLGLGDVIRIATDIPQPSLEERLPTRVSSQGVSGTSTFVSTTTTSSSSTTDDEASDALTSPMVVSAVSHSDEASTLEAGVAVASTAPLHRNTASDATVRLYNEQSQSTGRAVLISSNLNNNAARGWQPSAIYLQKRKRQEAARQQATRAAVTHTTSVSSSSATSTASTPSPASTIRSHRSARAGYVLGKTRQRKVKLKQYVRKRSRAKQRQGRCFRF